LNAEFNIEPKDDLLMNADEVAAYLKAHPEFFEQYGEVVADLSMPSPHGGRAISISERQIFTLRERSKKLESKLAEMIQFGEENDVIIQKIHRFTLSMIRTRGLLEVVHAIDEGLHGDFVVPQVALRLWHDATPSSLRPSAALHHLGESLTEPQGGSVALIDATELFGDAAADLQSYAYVPLRTAGVAFGLLVMASEDERRFYAEMGTVYLTCIGDLIAASLQRELDAA
jgi:uncharacterized protein YigA (DUF484 family)